MSAFVAPPLARLPNHNLSPQDLSDFTANPFDHMAMNASHEVAGNISSPQNVDRSYSPIETAADEDRSEAVGNLLAALSAGANETVHSNGPLEAGTIVSSGLAITTETPSHSISIDDASILTDNGATFPAWDPAMMNGTILPTDLPAVDTNGVDLAQSNGDFDATQLSSPHGMPSGDLTNHTPHTPEQSAAARTRIEYEAFGKLVFQDGNFYLNTYAIELGRDVHAFRAAIAREQEARQEQEAVLQGKARPRSSANRSHLSGRHVGSQVQGSIVSEAGGFAGVDDEANDQKDGGPLVQGSMHHSSQASDASATVKPHEVLMDPKRIPQFDYHKRVAEYAAEHGQTTVAEDDEKPAAVTEDHLPNPHMIPLIPIHGTMQTAEADVEGHKAISRRHVRISWNFEKDQWEMTVLGRNGAFLNGEFKKQGWTVKIDHGSKIQISHVEMTFCLPTQPDDQTKDESEDETMLDASTRDDDVLPSIEQRPSITPIPDAMRRDSQDQKPTVKVNLKTVNQTPLVDENGEVIRGPDGKPVYKKRGPGRPPKNGIMSNRELKEREKARKAEEAKAANGGKTPPPPMMRGKIVKPDSSEPLADDKSDKRKYKKRKRFDEHGQPLPSVEGEDSEPGEDEERKAKKARPQREKSESPEYPAKDTLTSEQLQRPTDPYATLLYKLLMEVWPEALALKQIYRLMKQKWPYFVHEVGTEGWQSSVRHNLNSEYMKLFDKGDKEGKGYAWKAIPNATLPQQDRKKAATQQAPPKPKPPQQQQQHQKPQFPPGPGQISFHNTTAYPQPAAPQRVMSNGQWQPPNPTQSQNWQGQPQSVAGPNHNPTAQSAASAQAPLPLVRPTNPAGAVPQSQNGTPQPQGAGVPPPVKNLPPPPVSGGSAPPNMPCTWGGIEAIKKFEKELLKQLDGKGPRNKEFWVVAFKSASRRCLHGATESLLEEGDTKEEQTLIAHINFFVNNFANPNFRGFANQAYRPPIPNPAPAPMPAPPTADASVGAVPAATANGSVSQPGQSAGVKADEKSTSPHHVTGRSTVSSEAEA